MLTTVTAQSDPEFFFGLRGAAPLFSIVTAMTVRTFPVPQTVRRHRGRSCQPRVAWAACWKLGLRTLQQRLRDQQHLAHALDREPIALRGL